MDIELSADVSREVGRHASDVAGGSTPSVNGHAARETSSATGSRADYAPEMPGTPVGGPEYTGRA
jgi:hypothetical protein